MNKTVEQMINFKPNGNIIDHAWYQTLTRKNGKTYIEAVIILGEIVFWYRPKAILDEATGQVIRYKQRFKADLLQRSYQSFADKFGFGKDQTRNAVAYLEERGVIKRKLRTVKIKDGTSLSNVLFIDLLFEGLKAITELPEQTPIRSETDTLPAQEPIPISLETDTYTKTTTKNTTNITTTREFQAEKDFRDQGFSYPLLAFEFFTGLNAKLQKENKRLVIPDREMWEIKVALGGETKDGYKTIKRAVDNFINWINSAQVPANWWDNFQMSINKAGKEDLHIAPRRKAVKQKTGRPPIPYDKDGKYVGKPQTGRPILGREE